MTTVYRIGHCPNPVPPEATLLAHLSYGSTLGNGRWHTWGRSQVVYCCSSRALCQLEKRVHSNGANPKDQALMRLVTPNDEPLDSVGTAMGLPTDWRSDEASTQAIGDAWIASGSALGLWVPSFLEPSEMNMLLNPNHASYRTVRLHIERHPFKFDPRLF